MQLNNKRELIYGELTEEEREGLLLLWSEIGLRRTVVRSETRWTALLRNDCFLFWPIFFSQFLFLEFIKSNQFPPFNFLIIRIIIITMILWFLSITVHRTFYNTFVFFSGEVLHNHNLQEAKEVVENRLL
jgi:hypothetical protein